MHHKPVIGHRGRAGLTALGLLAVALGGLSATNGLISPARAMVPGGPHADRSVFWRPSLRPTRLLTTPWAITLSLPTRLRVGGEVGTVTVQLADRDGHPVPDGSPVDLSSSLGFLDRRRLLTVAGVASTSLRSGMVAGTAVVVARCGEVSATGSVILEPTEAVALGLLAPAMASVAEPAEVAVTARDRFDNLIQEGLTITFGASSGAVEPQQQPLRDGVAVAQWTNRVAGVATVTASWGSLRTAADVLFRSDRATQIEVRVDPPAVPVIDGVATVEAIARDAYGNLAFLDAPVTFEAADGIVVPATRERMDGVARTAYHAGPRAGTVVLTALAGGLRGSTTVAVRPADLRLALAELAGPRGPMARSQTYPGEPVTLTLVVANAGMAKAREVRLAAEVPELMAARPLQPPEGARLLQPPAGEILGPPAAANETFAWQLPDVASGEALTLTLVGRTERSHAWSGLDTLPVRAAVTTTTSEASPFDLRRSDSLQIYSADLLATVAVDGQASAIRPGGWLVYDIAFANLQSQTKVHDVVITSTLGAGLSYDHWQPQIGTTVRPMGSFTDASRELEWAFDGPFGVSQGIRLWLNIDERLMPDTPVEHEVAIGSAVHDVNTSNNQDAIVVPLRGTNLVAELHAPATIAPGEELAYEVVVRNAVAADSASQVLVEMTVPAALRLLRTHPLGVLLADGRVQWRLDELAAGGERRFEVVCQVPEDAPLGAFYRGQLVVRSEPADAFADDNEAQAWTRVVAGSPASIVLQPSTSAMRACSEDQATFSAVVRDRVGNPVADGTLVDWRVWGGGLAASQSATASGLAQTVVTAGPASGPLTVRATSGSASAERSIELQPGPPTNVQVSLRPEVAYPGDWLAVDVAVRSWCGNSVSDGWPVELAAENATFGDGLQRISLATVGGQVAERLRAGPTAGALRVTARAGTVEGQGLARVVARPLRPVYFPLALAPRPGTAGR